MADPISLQKARERLSLADGTPLAFKHSVMMT
jgi:hypothetical protein